MGSRVVAACYEFIMFYIDTWLCVDLLITRQGRVQGLEKRGGSKVMYEAPKARNEAHSASGVGVGLGGGYPTIHQFNVF